MHDVLRVLRDDAVPLTPEGESAIACAIERGRSALSGLAPPPKRRGRPVNRKAELIYLAAQEVWVDALGQRWTRSSSDRNQGPLFDGYGTKLAEPDNAAAKFLVAFAQAVDPEMTVANLHAVHDRLRRERFWSSEALERRREARDYAQFSRKAAEVTAWWRAYNERLDSTGLLAEIEAEMERQARTLPER